MNRYHSGVGAADVYVFASNLAGVHTQSDEQVMAVKQGARWGKGMGRQGRTYAIPTESATFKTLSTEIISAMVHTFLEYARAHPELTFFVARFDGIPVKRIAPMFGLAPENCILPKAWQEYVEDVRTQA